MKVALVHDWLTSMRGSELVLGAVAELFPKATLFTVFVSPGKISPGITALKRETSFIQKIPAIEKRYLEFAALMPRAIESLDLSGYDLIISSSNLVAHGVKKRPGALHVSYFHTTEHDAFKGSLFKRYLKRWEQRVVTRDRIDAILTNSRHTQTHILKNYGRESEVIPSFCELDRFTAPRRQGRTYLMVSDFLPRRRLIEALEVFTVLNLPLMVVGTGPVESKLKKLAPKVDFMGNLSNHAMNDLYAKCKALVIPGPCDFGVTALEAMAAGSPVIAFDGGGVRETVTAKTGFFFGKNGLGLVDVLQEFERNPERFSEADCRARASEFTREKFQKSFVTALFKAWDAHQPKEHANTSLLSAFDRTWVQWDVKAHIEGPGLA